MILVVANNDLELLALRAVRNDAVIVLDPDISSRWGPRIVELFRSVVDATGDVR